MTSSPTERRLTVVHSVPRWLPQTENWLYNQVRYLPCEVENHIVCEKTENLDQFELPNIHSFSKAPCQRYFLDKVLRKLGARSHLEFTFRLARMKQVKLIHSHHGPTGWSNAKAARELGLGHIVTFYGQDASHFIEDHRWRERYISMFELVDFVICLGPDMARRIASLGCSEDKIRVNHLGVNIDDIEFTHRTWSPPLPLRVLIAASFREKKGITYALEALGALQQEVDLEVTIIGDASRDPRSQAEKRKIFAAIEEYGLQTKVRLLGYQLREKLLKEAYLHHVFLAPSITSSDGDAEGTPVVLMEMAATGILVISTRHSDIPEVVVDGVTGLLAEEGDVEGLTRHLGWLAENTDRWSRLALAGRGRMEMEFNARRQAEKQAALYKLVVGSPV